jgi:hypothetical protein
MNMGMGYAMAFGGVDMPVIFYKDPWRAITTL